MLYNKGVSKIYTDWCRFNLNKSELGAYLTATCFRVKQVKSLIIWLSS